MFVFFRSGGFILLGGEKKIHADGWEAWDKVLRRAVGTAWRGRWGADLRVWVT